MGCATRIILGALHDSAAQIHVLQGRAVLQLLNTLSCSVSPKQLGIDISQVRVLNADLLDSTSQSLPTVADMMTRPGIRSEILLLPDQDADT